MSVSDEDLEWDRLLDEVLGAWSKSDSSTLKTVFSAVHGVGKGVLNMFGAGAVADVLEPLEQQGGMLDKPVAKPPAQVQKDAKTGAPVQQQQPAGQSQQPAVQQQSAQPQKTARWAPWAVGGAAAVGLAAIIFTVVKGSRATP